MKNNLFTYATSELSQDAFICWLLSYAMKDTKKDNGLSMCAKEFLYFFIENKDEKEITVNEIKRQLSNIDILVTVNNKYKIIIEDKVFTSEHDNQLERYIQKLKNSFGDEYIYKYVYWKTGFQSDYSEAIKNNYLIMDRKSILNTMCKYLDKTDNDIFHDYYEYWNCFDRRSEEYRELPITKWTWNNFFAFCEYLKNEFGKQNINVNYDFVNNKDGGFYAIWGQETCKTISLGKDDIVELYLQFEMRNDQIKLCIKSLYNNKNNIIELRDSIMYSNNEYRFEKYGFAKPKRVRIWKNNHCC